MVTVDSRTILSSYPGFIYCRSLRTSRALISVNLVIALGFSVVILIAGYQDNSFFLEGRNVGLFEHPAIFAFLITQCIVPYSVLRAIDLFFSIPIWGSIISPDFLAKNFRASSEWVKESIRRQTKLGSILYSLLVAIGFSAFAWNSISNQDPMHFVGFDFWDSSRHAWGYWVTRVYKFYMWVLFFPALVHIEALILICIRRVVVTATRERCLVLEPYHPDQSGGIKVLMDTILIPLVPPLIISSLLALSAVLIHKRLDLTTVGGLALVCITFLSLYFTLASALRNAVISEKTRQLQLIANIQNNSYFQLVKDSVKEPPSEVESRIAALENLAKHIRGIPNWPQLKFALQAVSLAGTSPVATWIFGLLSPKIVHFLGL